MEPTVLKLIEIGWIVFSFAVGFLSFYLLDDRPKQQKKKDLDQISSQLINLILFIWLSKIILHLPLFISDPLAVLAYPSDSSVFYLGLTLTTLFLIIQSRRGKIDILSLVEPFLFVFFISSFIYEFIEFVTDNNPYAFGYLILLTILIASFLLLKERLKTMPFLVVNLSIWSLGMIVLSVIQPFVTVFGFIMAPWFIAMVYIGSMIGLLIKYKAA